MTVNLYMTWETPYLPAVAGLTVEAWPASDFTHSPVGNPSAYPPAPSPTATTTTDSSGDCELTGLTAATDYYISIIDQNNQPWFQFCPGGYLGNSSGTRRRWSINQGPVAPVAAVPAQIMGRVHKRLDSSGIGTLDVVTFAVVDFTGGGMAWDGVDYLWTPPDTDYYEITGHVNFYAASGFAAGDEIILLLYHGVGFSSQSAAFPPVGATIWTLEINDVFTGSGGPFKVTLVTGSATNVVVEDGSYSTCRKVAT